MKYLFDEKELIFTEEVRAAFGRFKQVTTKQHESGGILLGRIFPSKIVVDGLSVPSHTDRSGRYFFDRSVKKAQRIVDKVWKDSGGEVNYLGEWHTHPEVTPTPSPADKALISNMLRDTKMEIDFLLMVIVGTHDYYVAAQKKGGQLERLERH